MSRMLALTFSRRILRSLGVALLASTLCWAQEPPPPPATLPAVTPTPTSAAGSGNVVTSFLRDWAQDQKRFALSPFHMNKKQAFGIVLPLAVTTFALTYADADAGRYPRTRPNLRRASNYISTVGAGYTLGGLTLGTLLYGDVNHHPETMKMGRNGMLALAGALTDNYALKFAFGRERPSDNDGEGRFWKGKDTFPSGHAMTTFAVASALSHTKGCPKWVKITSYSVAAAVSFARWGAHRHYPSDILAGATLGYLMGKSVAANH